jgi:TonB family protein
MLSQAGLSLNFGVKWPLGLFPTYCFDKGDGVLRFGLFDGSIQEIFNKVSLFEGHYIAKVIELSDDAKPLLHIHLQELTSISATEAHTLLPPAASHKSDTNLATVPSGVITGRKVGGPAPRYPADAKRQLIQGTVVLKAVIGTDGRIHQFRVVSSPHSLLTISALAAVQRWIYKPYLLKGEPVRVETTINVVYNMGTHIDRL